MARIRSIKPEFFKHLELQELECANPGQHVMLVYAGLWTQCDKNGVFFCNSRVLKNEILPYVNFDIQKTLTILEQDGYFQRFKDGNREYGYIKNFCKYQFPTRKEKESPAKYPLPPEESGDCPGNLPGDYPGMVPGNDAGNLPGAEGLKDNRITGLKDYTAPEQNTTAVAVAPKASIKQKQELNPEQLMLYHAAKACFEADDKSKAIIYQDKATTARELKHLKTLVIRCFHIAPGVSAEFMRSVLEHFALMCKGKYRGKWVFTPQNLITPWIWGLVIDTLPEKELPGIRESIRGMFG